MVLAGVFLLFAHVAFAAPAGTGAPSQFEIQIDTSGAEAILAAATAPADRAAAAADAALHNAAVQAMITKMAKYDAKVSRDAFKAAVIANAKGGSDAPFALAELRKNPAPARHMLNQLVDERAMLEARLSNRLAEFAPPGLNVRGRMLVVDGTPNQDGWVPNDGVADFYINAGFHRDDIDGLIVTAQHEMFHVVQGMVIPHLNAQFEDQPTLAPEPRGRYRAHAVLLNLVIEGMATYVGDPFVAATPGKSLARDRRELQRNLDRAGQIFALFDTVLYRARHDPASPLDDLLTIGFGGSWDQTGYYVGYRMSKAIDHYSGRARLGELVAAPPQDFVAEYVKVAQAHPADPEITPLAPSSIAIVDELENLDARNAQ
jgi:hypothetical protein